VRAVATEGPFSGNAFISPITDALGNASNGTVGVGLSGTGCRISFLDRDESLICQ
jgi:hypothetical protein